MKVVGTLIPQGQIRIDKVILDLYFCGYFWKVDFQLICNICLGQVGVTVEGRLIHMKVCSSELYVVLF